MDVLRAAFFALKRRAAPGIDAVTWEDYEKVREQNLADLHRRLHAGTYRALPSRRTYIPKADGRQRPLGIAALEDKIIQAAVVIVLTPIYEAEFLGFSYGVRPGRGQHDALDALAYGIKGRNIRWILDADIRSFFDMICHNWLVRFLEHRIGDRRITRLIQKWLKAGVLDAGRHVETEEGTPQGALRGVAVGRKNWTFAWSDRGGERAAVIYTLIETAKLNGVDPQAWLAEILAGLADHSAKRIGELLPWNWCRAVRASTGALG